MADVKVKAPLHALSYKVAEFAAETVFKTLSDMNAETLGEMLHDTLAKDEGQSNW